MRRTVMQACLLIATIFVAIVSGCRDSRQQAADDKDRSPGLGCADPEEPGTKSLAQLHEERLEQVESTFGFRPAPKAEAHDCQQLILVGTNGAAYGPFVTLWASESLATVANFDQPTVIGAIYMRGSSGGYTPLKIRGDTSCIVVQGTSTDPTWKMYVIRVTGSAACLSLPPQPWPDTLTVHRVVQTASKRPVALRINDTGGRYEIGFQCLNKWCVAVEEGVTSADSKAPTHGAGDRQRLGYWDGNTLVPSDMFGTITPSDSLEMWVHADSFKVARVVAKMIFEGGDSTVRRAYAKKLRLLPVKEVPDTVLVYLTHSNGKYYFRYNSGGTKEANEVQLNNGTHLKASARWRWVPRDEGTWIECPLGCCGDS